MDPFRPADPAEPVRHLRRRLARVLDHAARLPAWCDPLAHTAGVNDPVERLRALPVLDREAIQARPDAFRDPRPRSVEIHTSGSTGRPLTYHLDHRARVGRLAAYARFFWMHGWRPWDRSLSLKVLPDSSDRVGAAWIDRTLLAGRRVASAVSPPEEIFRAFRESDPHVLHGLPSAIECLGAEIERRGWRPRRLRRIFTSSEQMDPATRVRIEGLFRAPVIDHYGAAEGFIAWQCEQLRDYHINERQIFLELLDDEDRPVAPGTPGRVVLTTLDNRAMPLLRYAIGDLAVEAETEACPCGRPGRRLDRVLGRVMESFVLDGRAVSPWAAVSRMREIPGLGAFQLLQTGPLRVEARVDWRGSPAPGDVKALLRETLHPKLEVEVVATDTFLRLPSGKRAPALRVDQAGDRA